MGAGGFAQKHGVGIPLNQRWKRKIIQTKYVSERMSITTLLCDQRKIELTSVYFPHSGYADMDIEKMYKNIETHCSIKKHIRIIADDSNALLGRGKDSECDHVGQQATVRFNKRGIWMKQWLVTQDHVALITTFKQTSENNTPYRSTSGKEKQLDYV